MKTRPPPAAAPTAPGSVACDQAACMREAPAILGGHGHVSIIGLFSRRTSFTVGSRAAACPGGTSRPCTRRPRHPGGIGLPGRQRAGHHTRRSLPPAGQRRAGDGGEWPSASPAWWQMHRPEVAACSAGPAPAPAAPRFRRSAAHRSSPSRLASSDQPAPAQPRRQPPPTANRATLRHHRPGPEHPDRRLPPPAPGPMMEPKANNAAWLPGSAPNQQDAPELRQGEHRREAARPPAAAAPRRPGTASAARGRASAPPPARRPLPAPSRSAHQPASPAKAMNGGRAGRPHPSVNPAYPPRRAERGDSPAAPRRRWQARNSRFAATAPQSPWGAVSYRGHAATRRPPAIHRARGRPDPSPPARPAAPPPAAPPPRGRGWCRSPPPRARAPPSAAG